MFVVKRLLVLLVSEQDHTIRELRVELRQGKNSAVAVGSLDDEIARECLSTQVLAELHAGRLEQFDEGDPVVISLLPVVVLGVHGLAGQLGELLGRQFKRMLDLTFDAHQSPRLYLFRGRLILPGSNGMVGQYRQDHQKPARA